MLYFYVTTITANWLMFMNIITIHTETVIAPSPYSASTIHVYIYITTYVLLLINNNYYYYD